MAWTAEEYKEDLLRNISRDASSAEAEVRYLDHEIIVEELHSIRDRMVLRRNRLRSLGEYLRTLAMAIEEIETF